MLPNTRGQTATRTLTAHLALASAQVLLVVLMLPAGMAIPTTHRAASLLPPTRMTSTASQSVIDITGTMVLVIDMHVAKVNSTRKEMNSFLDIMPRKLVLVTGSSMVPHPERNLLRVKKTKKMSKELSSRRDM